MVASRVALLLALPLRIQVVARHVFRQVIVAVRWLALSREHTNFTYDLEPRSVEHLCWFVSNVTARPIEEIRGFVRELEEDVELREHVRTATRAADRRWLADDIVRYGRRLGWYAFVRATNPALVVETGTDKGLGTCVIAAALLRNGSGKVVTIDLNRDSGYLLGPPYSDVIDRWVGDSVSLLPELSRVDMFLHDSLHTPEHELAELATLDLSPDAWVLSDNSHATDALATWAESTGRNFLFFDERPAHHWYPGAGIGVAWRYPYYLQCSATQLPSSEGG